MQTKKLTLGITFTIFLFLILLLTACSSTKTVKSDKIITNKINSTTANALTIVTATAKQDSQWIIIDAKMKNDTTTAQTLKSNLFALVSNNTILSPDSKSEIPQQIPAKTMAEFKIQFDPKDLEGEVPLKLAYQPINHSEPEQFFTIGKLIIKKVATSEKPNVNQQASTPTPATVQSPTPKPAPPKIDLQTETLGNVVNVKVPVGWIKTPNDGGDFGGFHYINPKDANEQMLVIYSACAGCGYANSNPETDTPDPVSLINQEHIIQSYVFQNGLSAGYSYYVNGNPYIGNGVVKMKQEAGYAFVEIVLPDSEKSIATQVLNSFQFSGF